MKYFLFLIMLLVGIQTTRLSAQSLSSLKQHLQKSLEWNSPTLNRSIPLNIYFQGKADKWETPEVIVYLKNKAWERIGQESDESILSDYIRKGFIVITADYNNDARAVSPAFDKDLSQLFRGVYGYQTPSFLEGLNLRPAEYRCFFLPEGYRVATNLVYWEIDKHGVHGTLDYILKSYNEDIVPKVPGLKKASTPSEMVDLDGKPFDFKIKMDIVYPSQAKKKLPVMFLSETQASRNPNGQPKGYVPHLAGFTTRGYVYAVIGHCFNPCVTHFFHFSKFTLDHENGYACYTAAIRYLNAHAGKYNMDTRHIGGIGYSKGQYAITRLSDPNHRNDTSEVRKFKGYPDGTPQPQPWPGYPSKISAGMQGMGMGLFEPEYITTDYAPTLIVCGEKERDVISKQGHPKFVQTLEEKDANHLNLFMQGLEHELPYGYDQRMGVDRYKLVHDFFDRYLKPDEKLPPVALVVSPRDAQQDVSPTQALYVHFAPVIDERTVLEKNGIRIIRLKDNKEIDGDWKVSHGGTRFTYVPHAPLEENQQYEIAITSKIRNKAGTKLKDEKAVRFEVAATAIK